MARIGVIRATDAYVRESMKVGNHLFVLFEPLSDWSDIISGVAQFRGGLFGSHSLRPVSHSDRPLYAWREVSEARYSPLDRHNAVALPTRRLTDTPSELPAMAAPMRPVTTC